ncbi:DCD domain-containing protein [Abeliophyllum distichum]|uniref:DCD domain-containing protein n=1 Tax=Abeliophyllum distichum TaxID=126358 RepID=A0ABD1PEK3_9LAMI
MSAYEFELIKEVPHLLPVPALSMAKEKRKKLKKKGRNMNQQNKNKVPKVEPKNAVVPGPAPLTDPTKASTSTLPSEENRAPLQNKETDKETKKNLSGFIFMCNQNTKSECYQYRVFGLPIGKKEVVDTIKPWH